MPKPVRKGNGNGGNVMFGTVACTVSATIIGASPPYSGQSGVVLTQTYSQTIGGIYTFASTELICATGTNTSTTYVATTSGQGTGYMTLTSSQSGNSGSLIGIFDSVCLDMI